MVFTYTPLEDIPAVFSDLQKTFRTGKTKPIAYRKEQLAQVAWMLRDHQQEWADALKADLGRPSLEADFLEINPAISEAKDAYDNVEKWSKTEKARWDMTWSVMKPQIRKEPKGVVLIITPFNFPVHLTITHVSSAIAAGNCVVIKPSELCPAVSELYAELVPKYLDSETVRVVNGDVPVVSKLLEFPWDHIVYVGSGRVAKIVAAAAAKHLTPLTTELGGKSPVFIDPNTDFELAAKRVLWGKLANAGQVCVAPDYVLIPRDAQDRFVEEVKKVYASFYPEGDPSKSDSFSRIITEAHTARIKKLIDESKGTVVFGGEANVQEKYVAPTLLKDVTLDDSTMQEEIFGPVLPIVPVEDVNEAINIVNDREHALCLYVFSNDPKYKAKVFDNTQSGGAIANETIIHVGATGLPFGGIGPSGCKTASVLKQSTIKLIILYTAGYLSGKYGFDILTHHRCTLDNPRWVDTVLMKGRYPPYTEKSTSFLKKMTNVTMPPRFGKAASKRWGLWLVFTLLGIVTAVLIKRQTA
ncbi:Aldehyde/histidinol dehydrogenase [Irpex rosettiformis]|uniref:Aldehyde/histidinol dehydrogenase n=1 Tax=Irpex rosettiformis TaxID=378272 RepID=A0ACB8TPW6_9APHY|nr:Aldehyde/histidinol dehydrogenase [Irpex rosettiformis]